MADRNAMNLQMPLPGDFKAVDSVRSKDQINVERAGLELDEVFATFDFGSDLVRQFESKILQRLHQRLSVGRRFFRKDVHILSGVRKSQHKRSGLSQQQIPHPSVV